MGKPSAGNAALPHGEYIAMAGGTLDSVLGAYHGTVRIHGFLLLVLAIATAVTVARRRRGAVLLAFSGGLPLLVPPATLSYDVRFSVTATALLAAAAALAVRSDTACRGRPTPVEAGSTGRGRGVRAPPPARLLLEQDRLVSDRDRR